MNESAKATHMWAANRPLEERLQPACVQRIAMTTPCKVKDAKPLEKRALEQKKIRVWLKPLIPAGARARRAAPSSCQHIHEASICSERGAAEQYYI